ncbi:MAG: hypothetical protein K5770_11965 [Lachnospiraceae bacterium]|nr:hypothetical protein [Lachnospiraceae bacterium]
MPKEGVFAIVLRGGYIKTGDKMDVLTDDYEPEDRFTDDRDSASEENPSIEKDTDTAGGIAPEPVQHPRKSFAEDPKESLSDEMKNPAGEDLPEEVAVSIQDHFIKRDEEQERDIIAGSERQSAESLAEKPGEHGRTNAHRSVLRAAVITVSDRSYKGEREDLSGPKICSMLKGYGYVVSDIRILPDEEDLIYTELVRLSDTCRIDIVFTTGGTGFSERDRTPEATMRAAERNAPGISEAIRAESMKHTKRAMLSRGASVIRGRTLIINLPGSPKAVEECLSFLLPELEHGILILKGEADG